MARGQPGVDKIFGQTMLNQCKQPSKSRFHRWLIRSIDTRHQVKLIMICHLHPRQHPLGVNWNSVPKGHIIKSQLSAWTSFICTQTSTSTVIAYVLSILFYLCLSLSVSVHLSLCLHLSLSPSRKCTLQKSHLQCWLALEWEIPILMGSCATLVWDARIAFLILVS